MENAANAEIVTSQQEDAVEILTNFRRITLQRFMISSTSRILAGCFTRSASE
jgi:hypothetical protein